MALVIRLSRHGKKMHPLYRIVVADEDFPRDGRYLEILGTYNPKTPEAKGALNKERLDYWMSKGARPSATVGQIMKRSIAKPVV